MIRTLSTRAQQAGHGALLRRRALFLPQQELARCGRYLCATKRSKSSGADISATADGSLQKPDFDDAAAAYSAFPTSYIWRAVLVFNLCDVKPLVENAEVLLNQARRILGDGFVDAVVRPTFFSHFCAGEGQESIRPTIEFLRANGVGAILDYAAEADIAEEDEKQEQQVQENVLAHRYKGVESARVYTYESEEQCDANAKIFEDAIRAVHNVTPEGFAAIKITGLCNPVLLERWSVSLQQIRNLFDRMDEDNDGLLTLDEFLSGWTKHFHHQNEDHPLLRSLFNRFDKGGQGTIDSIEWTTTLRPEDMYRYARQCIEEGPFHQAALNKEETMLMQRALERVANLVSLADELGVRLMIDAEHSYFQPAIDNIVLDMQRKFNTRERACVYNTFQCYLKETPQKLNEHIERAEREGWHFAAKVVRGAYMVMERERAASMGYESPIHDSIEDTHACFDAAVERIMTRDDVATGSSRVNMLVASHNQLSIERTIDTIERLGMDPTTCGVSFGQLLGMSDHLSFSLGAAGFKAYKYVPYGPIHEVLPYLVRRAQENAGMLSNAKAERGMLLQELRRRILG